MHLQNGTIVHCCVITLRCTLVSIGVPARSLEKKLLLDTPKKRIAPREN